MKDQEKKLNKNPETKKAKQEQKAIPSKFLKEADIKKIAHSVPPRKCPLYEPFKSEDIQDKEITAENTHFVKGGEVFRIRVFLEDGDNGSFKKLVLYKEDKSGFPRIEKLPDDKRVNPSKEYIKSFLKNSKIIHHEMDIRYELKDDREISITQVNGKIVKLNSEQDDCFFEKQ